MNKERNLYLDILKGINIMLVILGHCIQYGSGREYYQGIFFNNSIFVFVYSFHMPLFGLISGYLFADSLKRKKWDELLLVRFKQLLIPLCGWSAISLFIAICKSVIGISSETINVLWMLKKLATGFLYGPWFVWAVWWCGFVIIIVRRFLKDSLIVYILGSLLTFITPDDHNLLLYKFMWPFFLLSYVFNAYDYKSKLKKIYINKVFILFSLIIFGVMLHFYNYDSYIYTSGYTIIGKNVAVQIYNDIFRFFIGMVGSLTVMYLVYALVKVLPDKIKVLFAYIGKNTLGIYMISGIIFSEILLKVTFRLRGVNYLYIFIETICILSLSIMTNAVLKRFKLTNSLFLGGR